MTQDRLHVPRPGLVRAGHGPRRSPRPQARGDGRVRRRQQGVGPRPARALLRGHRRGADADRGAAAGARRDQPRDQRRAARARDRRPTTSSGHSVGEFSALGAAELDGRRRGDRPRARARPRDGRRREGAARLDGRDPRPRRRGGRGASAARSRTCGRRTTTAPASSSSPARRTPSTRPAPRRSTRARAARSGCKVSGAFHSPLVEHAAERLRPAIDRIDFKVPTAQFVSTVTAKLEDVEPLPLAARRAADRAGAVHAGRARAGRAAA